MYREGKAVGRSSFHGIKGVARTKGAKGKTIKGEREKKGLPELREEINGDCGRYSWNG